MMLTDAEVAFIVASLGNIAEILTDEELELIRLEILAKRPRITMTRRPPPRLQVIRP